MPRQARLDAPGTLHHVIVRGIERRPIVSDRRDRGFFVHRLGQVATETNTIVYAWALLSNHAHFLLRSGPDGLSKMMQRFLVGYAMTYNRRHHRHGHLFQNRYKSMVCEEDAYFRELVRYIHLNPLRAGLVRSLSELDRYRWCGHAVLMGRVKQESQDRDYVLSWFGDKEGIARRAYRQYVKSGIGEGRRPDLVGGGLVRSVGGWSEVLSLRRAKQQILTDERILGSGDFVETVLEEAEERLKHQLGRRRDPKDVAAFIDQRCEEEHINAKELRSGSRRGRTSEVRSTMAIQLVEQYGLPLAEVGRHLGVSTSAISKAITRRMER